jgi:hypothetical protein
MSYTEFQVCPRIISGGGAITDNTVKSYYSSGATSEDWYAGMPLVQKNDGTVTPASGNSSSEAIRYIALKDHDSSAEGKSVFVAVQAITPSTIFEGQYNASSTGSGDAVQATIGDQYDIKIDATTHNWGPDIDDQTGAIVEITDIGSNYRWFEESSATDYGICRFKFIAETWDNNPA